MAELDARGIGGLLERTARVAIVGVSANPSRPSHDVAGYLLGATTWTIWMVNPTIESVHGEPAYPSLHDLPGTPDIVDVFRRPEHLAGVVEESILVGAGAVWFQLGLRDDVAARRAVAAGLDVVQDHCLKIEHARHR